MYEYIYIGIKNQDFPIILIETNKRKKQTVCVEREEEERERRKRLYIRYIYIYINVYLPYHDSGVECLLLVFYNNDTSDMKCVNVYMYVCVCVCVNLKSLCI